MAWLDNLISSWKANESSGSLLDSHGTNHLTDNNTVGSATGKIGSARDFEADNVEYFSIADNADLTTGDINHTHSVWVKFESLGADRTVLTKSTSGASTSEYDLQYRSSNGLLRFRTFSGGGNTQVEASNFGALSTGVWYHVVCWADATNDLIGISVNGGTANTTSTGGGAQNSIAVDFYIGGRDGSVLMDGLLDEVNFWKRVLTSQERTDLYNSGNGLSYPFTPLTQGLISYWDCDATSGALIDVHGTNDLTDKNTVGTAAGKIGNARDFESDNSESFTLTDNADLSTGNIDFTVAAWVKFESIGSNRGIVTKASGTGTPSLSEYDLTFRTANSLFSFRTHSAATSREVQSSNFGALSVDVWYHVVAWHDAANDLIGISVNAGTANTTATAGDAPNDAIIDFAIGAIGGAVQDWNMDGLIDEVGFWKRVLTATERSNLYNGGAGLAYPLIEPVGHPASRRLGLARFAAINPIGMESVKVF